MRPTVTSPPRSRRRATLAGRRTKKGVTIGFHARGSDRIVPPDGCTLLDPVILALLPFVATITRITASRSGTLAATVTACDSGADIAVTGAKPLDAAMRASLAALAGDAQVARLTVNDETVALHSPPTLRIGPARVALPPGAFLQATRQGEAALQAAVAEAVAPARHIADLFAGCGTFSLPLAAGAAISAVDGDGAMMAALDAAWRGTPGLHAVATQTRDLFRRPLLRGELSAFDAAVIDPPRQGAEAQVAEIAASPLPVVAMVSCNPVTFARDAATLVAAGFHIDWVQPVDQFLWSPHVELAARFSR
jgi:23S rRNA (uracil1939-C5)-methyltransferase